MVAFLPAPDGDVLTFTRPQSDPFGPIHCKNIEKKNHNCKKHIRKKLFAQEILW